MSCQPFWNVRWRATIDVMLFGANITTNMTQMQAPIQALLPTGFITRQSSRYDVAKVRYNNTDLITVRKES